MKKEDLQYCYHCGQKGKLKKLKTVNNSYKENVGDEEYPNIIEFNDQIDIVSCKECTNVNIYRSEWMPDQERYMELAPHDSYVEMFGRLIYPPIEHENHYYIPSRIYDSYLASIKVQKIDRDISMIGFRRTLEMVCKDQGYNQGMLGKKLSDMSKDGVIPPAIDNIAKFLKDRGDEAAHGDDVAVNRHTLESIKDFTRIILNYIYVLPSKLDKAQKEIAKRDS